MQKFIIWYNTNALARTDRAIALWVSKKKKRKFPHSPQTKYTKVARGERNEMVVCDTWNHEIWKSSTNFMKRNSQFSRTVSFELALPSTIGNRVTSIKRLHYFICFFFFLLSPFIFGSVFSPFQLVQTNSLWIYDDHSKYHMLEIFELNYEYAKVRH